MPGYTVLVVSPSETKTDTLLGMSPADLQADMPLDLDSLDQGVPRTSTGEPGTYDMDEDVEFQRALHESMQTQYYGVLEEPTPSRITMAAAPGPSFNRHSQGSPSTPDIEASLARQAAELQRVVQEQHAALQATRQEEMERFAFVPQGRDPFEDDELVDVESEGSLHSNTVSRALLFYFKKHA